MPFRVLCLELLELDDSTKNKNEEKETRNLREKWKIGTRKRVGSISNRSCLGFSRFVLYSLHNLDTFDLWNVVRRGNSCLSRML
jgi:hypothetical protein